MSVSGSAPQNDSPLEELRKLMDQFDRESDGTTDTSPEGPPPLDLSSIPPIGFAPRQMPAWRPIHIILLIATFASTFLVGLVTDDGPPREGEIPGELDWPRMLANAATYSLAVMSILISHEMGHYLQARRHRVPASPPYFIPMPLPPFGTMGAVIVQRSGFSHRRALFDIAISGPLAGLIVALPILWIAISRAEIAPVPPGPVQGFGEPLLMQWMADLIHGPRPEGHDLYMTPLLMAGWFGILITALNLFPIGQLDGGHILYALIGKRAHYVAMFLLFGGVALMAYFNRYQYSLMLFLIAFMGPRHPPTGNDRMPLEWYRIVLGWLTLAFLIVGFTPVPFQF